MALRSAPLRVVALRELILREILFDQLGGGLAGYIEALGQSEGGDAVDDAEIDRLGLATHLGSDLLFGDAVDLHRSGNVDIAAALEGLHHALVSAQLCGDPEFYLRIVGGK